MNYKEVITYHNGILIKGIENFDLDATFGNKLVYRWRNLGNRYLGIVKDKVIQLGYISDGQLYIDNISLEEFEEWFMSYLDLDKDYTEMYSNLYKEPLLAYYIGTGKGLRIIKQELIQTVVCNFLTQNEEVMIGHRAIEKLCELYGKEIEYKGNKFYSFPTLDTLSKLDIEEWRKAKTGYWSSGISLAIKQFKRLEEEKGDLTTYFSNMKYDELQKFLGEFYQFRPRVVGNIIDGLRIYKDNMYNTDFNYATDINSALHKKLSMKGFGELNLLVKHVLKYYYNIG